MDSEHFSHVSGHRLQGRFRRPPGLDGRDDGGDLTAGDGRLGAEFGDQLFDSVVEGRADGVGAILGLVQEAARLGLAAGGRAGESGHEGVDLAADALAVARAAEGVAAADAFFFGGQAGEPKDHAGFGMIAGKQYFRGFLRGVGADVADGEAQMGGGHGLACFVEQISIARGHGHLAGRAYPQISFSAMLIFTTLTIPKHESGAMGDRKRGVRCGKLRSRGWSKPTYYSL